MPNKHVILGDDQHFRGFASSLKKARAIYSVDDDKNFLQKQKEQVDKLISLEKEFKHTLIAHPNGMKVYGAFINFICNERRNILDARPYFRERQHIFTQKISKALKNRSERRLYRFNFNYRFVQFVLNCRFWHPASKLKRIGRDILEIRNELIVMNMPLAISRARIFYSRTPKSHLSYMDLIQIASEGLMSGIDKFVPPFSKAFRSVAIGRMTGNFIAQYSETPIHFYPVDKRKIYRANKAVGRLSNTGDFDEVARQVNQGVDESHCTTASEISNLMAAASVVSMNTQEVSEDGGPGVSAEDSRYAAPADCQPDVIVERTDSLRNLSKHLSMLSILEQKLMRLKGIDP